MRDDSFPAGHAIGESPFVVGDPAEFGAEILHFLGVARKGGLRVRAFVARQAIGCSVVHPGGAPRVERTWRKHCASLVTFN